MTCCFTGHRPEKLEYPDDKIKELLRGEIKKTLDIGYTSFISGMARGTDIWAAQIVAEIKKDRGSIRLICAVPYPGVQKKWGKEWRAAFDMVVECADEVIFISESSSIGCFQKRNEWMVDHSDRLIAVFSGAKGGTYNTVLYATRKGKKVINII
ncbi:MAG: DUF1273 family protein [Clostridia bacterium]|nr:DUF1273 family protein [Clostridia bacterium]